MGLCKCPKKKVTTQFCFEHRVNVCENCLVDNHYQCIVNSYVNWLKDSDYSSTCGLCEEELSCKECIRLVCYDVFHWECLNHYAKNLPNNTAPAGYVCPTCSTKIFPDPKLVSPVADKLNEFLRRANWARTGLGLPLLEDEVQQCTNIVETSHPQENSGFQPPVAAHGNSESTYSSASPSYNEPNPEFFSASSSRRLMNTKLSDILIFQDDEDTDKYRRKSPFIWLKRWLKTLNHPFPVRGKPSSFRRKIMMIIIIILSIITIVSVLHWFGRSEGLDPAFDPRFNPNIKIGA